MTTPANVGTDSESSDPLPPGGGYTSRSRASSPQNTEMKSPQITQNTQNSQPTGPAEAAQVAANGNRWVFEKACQPPTKVGVTTLCLLPGSGRNTRSEAEIRFPVRPLRGVATQCSTPWQPEGWRGSARSRPTEESSDGRITSPRTARASSSPPPPAGGGYRAFFAKAIRPLASSRFVTGQQLPPSGRSTFGSTTSSIRSPPRALRRGHAGMGGRLGVSAGDWFVRWWRSECRGLSCSPGMTCAVCISLGPETRDSEFL